MKLFLFPLALLTSNSLMAQANAELSGRIFDPAKAAVPGASITITRLDTSTERVTTSNESGVYTVPALAPGKYEIQVRKDGFQTAIRSGLELHVDDRLQLDFDLRVGDTAQSVSVSGGAELVQTNGTINQVVEERRIVELPLNGRNAAELTLLVPGAARAPNAGVDQGIGKTFPGVIAISTNGSRQNQVSYNLDGGNHVDEYTVVSSPFPFPDALQEFSVQTSNYSAQYGQNSGGVVNVVTKSGTNTVHGSAFGFLRNKALNARNYFASSADELKRTQFGGTASGPLYIPKLYDGRNRTFWFAGYQGTRLRNIQRGLNAFVPTDANRAGDFSALLSATNPANPLGRVIPVLDPVTRQPFPNNQIPVNRFDPATLKLLTFVPSAGGNGRVQYSRPLRDNFNEFLVRVDQHISARDILYVRHFLDQVDNTSNYDGKNLLTLDNFASQRHQDAMLGETHVFGPRLLNEFRFNYTRTSSLRDQLPNVPTPADLGISIYNPIRALQSISATGFFSVGAGAPARYVRNGFNLGEDVRWSPGRHSFSFGGSISRSRIDFDNFFNLPGVYTFTNDITGYALANLMLGKMRNFRQGNGAFLNEVNYMPGLYVHDTFRASSRLTLDLGIRWDPFFPWNEVKGRMVTFNPDLYAQGVRSKVFRNSLPGLLFPGFGDPGPRDGISSDLNNFAPRFGFAFSPRLDGKTSIRGGGGVFYNSRMPGQQPSQIVQVTPISAQLTYTDPVGPLSNPYLGVQSPFPGTFPPAADAPFPTPVQVSAYSPTGKFPTPVTYNWNLTLDQQLHGNWLLRAAYVGSRSSHLQINLNINDSVYIPGSTLGTDARRRFTNYGNIFLGSQEGNSSYHALQLSAIKRFASGPRLFDGLTLLANYTFSKSIDDLTSGMQQTNFGPGRNQTLPYDLPGRARFDRGPSEFDHTHLLVLSYVWQLPVPASAHRVARAAFGGWQVTGIMNIQTGGPLTLLSGSDRSGSGLGADRVNYLGGETKGVGGCGATEAPCVNFLRTAAFAQPALGTFGNIGKGALRGPGYWNWDMGLFRTIPLAERLRLQFRFEYFNILNRANFNDPNLSLGAAGFGGIRSAADPRIGQAALKLTF